MNEYDRINKFLEDHGHKVEGGWEFLTPGIAVVTVMEAVIEIVEKIERMPGHGCIPPKFPPDLPEHGKGCMTDKEKITKALDFANQNGTEDGAHHKMWVIDQMVRALTGCPMNAVNAVDCNGNPYTYETQGESKEYDQFVSEMENNGYLWDKGVGP